MSVTKTSSWDSLISNKGSYVCGYVLQEWLMGGITEFLVKEE